MVYLLGTYSCLRATQVDAPGEQALGCFRHYCVPSTHYELGGYLLSQRLLASRGLQQVRPLDHCGKHIDL